MAGAAVPRQGALLTRALVVVGAIMVLGGAGHWIGVAVRARSAEGLSSPVPYLVLVGLAQVAAGASLLVAARALVAGEGAARSAARLAALVTGVYAAAVLPALADDAVVFQAAPVVYTVATLALALAVPRRALTSAG